jgi:23S rRNA pseudouridine2604 synthase
VRQQFINDITDGIKIHGEITKPCKAFIEPNTKRIFRIILTQGLNRQIRRMCNAFDYQVLKLQRIRVMNITLDKLKIGEWRDLTENEVKQIMSQLN